MAAASVFIATVLIYANPSASDSVDLTLRDDIASFLKKNVIGKTIISEVTYVADNGKMENVFSRAATYTNLVVTDEGLTFDVVSTIKQALYDLDGAGKRVGAGRPRNRVLVQRYELAACRTNPQLRGFSRVLANSMADPTGAVMAVTIRLEGNGSLILDSTSVQPGDQYSAEGGYKPGVSEISATYSLRAGVVHVIEVEHNYYIDLASRKRTLISAPVTLEGRSIAE